MKPTMDLRSLSYGCLNMPLRHLGPMAHGQMIRAIKNIEYKWLSLVKRTYFDYNSTTYVGCSYFHFYSPQKFQQILILFCLQNFDELLPTSPNWREWTYKLYKTSYRILQKLNWTIRIFYSPNWTIGVITCFCYILMISLDHKKVRFSHFFQMCSKSFQINF